MLKKNLASLKNRAVLGAFILLSPAVVFAETDYMAGISTTIGTGLTLALNVVQVLVFIIMIWAIMVKFSEASRGRASWAEVFLPFVIGAVVLAFLAVIGPEATTAVDAIGGG